MNMIDSLDTLPKTEDDYRELKEPGAPSQAELQAFRQRYGELFGEIAETLSYGVYTDPK